MGRSQATFSKKEKEKKKIQKRQEKEQKKEDRKATSNKGKSIEDMIAYVDENGNFTDTPPDPARKKDIKQEDIRIQISKQEDMEQPDPIRTGIVAFFNESKGYGFIKDQETQESIFVHLNGLIDSIKENNKVTFEIERTPKGPGAINVRLAP